MSEELRSILIGTAGLSVAALGALALTLTRGRPRSDGTELRGAARMAFLTLLLQAAHFGEELATGFRAQFPEQLGLVAWPQSFFVSFNVFWLAVWTLGIRGLLGGHLAALAALWFLGLAAAANGVVHPLLSVRAGGYFPGLFSSPVLGIAGILLLHLLTSITRRATAVRKAV